MAAIALQTLCNLVACESFWTLDMPKRLKYSVNVHQTCSKDDATKVQ